MYICKHCGLQYATDQAVVCVRCGAPRGAGNQFCPCCGNQIPPEQTVCMQCGVDTVQYGAMQSPKSKIAAGVFGLFLGYLGIHNFYLGYIKKALIQIGLFIFGTLLYASVIISTDELPYLNAAENIAVAGSFVILIALQIWIYIESFFILCGKINKDGKGLLLK